MPAEPSSTPQLSLPQALERAEQAHRQAEAVRDAVLYRLHEIRQRCVERLGSLTRDLDQVRGAGVDVPLEGSLAARVREIIDETSREIASIAMGEDAPASTTPVVPEGDLTGDPNALWLSEVMRHVPHPVVVGMLRAIDIAVVNSIAVNRPELLGEVLGSLPADEAARWLGRWELDAVASVLSTVDTNAAADWVDGMPFDRAVATFSALGERVRLKVLAELPFQTASRVLTTMELREAVRLLQLLPVDVAAEQLLQIEEFGLADPGRFIATMAGGTGDRCLRAMDRKRSERTEAVDLIRQIEVGRETRTPLP